MSDLFPNDPLRYYDIFKQQWKYIQTYMIDHTYGDWYANGTDIDPQIKTVTGNERNKSINNIGDSYG